MPVTDSQRKGCKQRKEWNGRGERMQLKRRRKGREGNEGQREWE